MDKNPGETGLLAKQQGFTTALTHAEPEMETWRLKTSMPHLLNHLFPSQFA